MYLSDWLSTADKTSVFVSLCTIPSVTWSRGWQFQSQGNLMDLYCQDFPCMRRRNRILEEGCFEVTEWEADNFSAAIYNCPFGAGVPQQSILVEGYVCPARRWCRGVLPSLLPQIWGVITQIFMWFSQSRCSGCQCTLAWWSHPPQGSCEVSASS